MNFIKNRLLNLFIDFQKGIKARKLKNQFEGGIITVGKHTYGINNLNIHVYRGSDAKVIIGKYCSIGPNLTIITGGIHPTNWVSTFPFRAQWNLTNKFEDGMPITKGDVIIGNDVWIGTNVTILSGVSIGHGAVLATAAIITKDVPPYAIVGGNPAKLIRFRWDENKISELLKMAWWDLPEDEIKKIIPFLNSPYL